MATSVNDKSSSNAEISEQCKEVKKVEGSVQKESSYQNTRNPKEAFMEKVNEQNEDENGICSNEMADELKMENLSEESDVILLGRNHNKDRVYYVVLGTIWIFTLCTRLYDIAQPPKIW